jgi:hypothetical protein
MSKEGASKMVDFTRPVTTRDGRKVRILCTDAKSTHPVVGLVTNSDDDEGTSRWCEDGKWLRATNKSDWDLVNPPVKKYINLFKNDVGRMYYDTREEAEKFGNASKNAGYVKTIEVEL